MVTANLRVLRRNAEKVDLPESRTILKQTHDAVNNKTISSQFDKKSHLDYYVSHNICSQTK